MEWSQEDVEPQCRWLPSGSVPSGLDRFVRSSDPRAGGDSSVCRFADVTASAEALQFAAHSSVPGGGLGRARVSVVSPTLASWN